MYRTIAQCYQDGEIHFENYLLDGAIMIIEGKENEVIDIIHAKARYAHDGFTLLVPGIPEAITTENRMKALVRFIEFCKE